MSLGTHLPGHSPKAGILLVANSALAAGEPDLTVRVRVYNYANVSSRVLSDSEEEASRIFMASGVDTTWVDCLAPQIHVQSAPADQAGKVNVDCAGPVTEATAVLRILPRSTPANRAFRDTMFGFATGRDMASVFYEHVKDLAWGADKDGNEIPLILGNVIAHEVGHLLLGTNSHSPAGIMCANWDQEYVRQALRGHQLFSREQSAVMRATVARRNQEIVQP